MVMATTIDTQDPFVFSANLAFDMPLAGMSMSIVEYSGDQEGDSELIARQNPLSSISNDKEDATLSTSIKRVRVDPSQSEDENAKYMFLLYEEQATYIFNEVAKIAETSNLCLRMSLQMSIRKKSQKRESTASRMQFDEKKVVDFRYMMNSAKGDPNHMVVPFNIKNIDVTTLYTQDVLDGEALMKTRPFRLEFYANDRLIESFLPVNIEKTANDNNQMYTTIASFKPNLNSLYREIRLASELKLKFKISPKYLDKDDAKPFVLTEKIEERMENYYLDVELPSDLKAKIQEKEKFEGTQVHDTLESVIEEQQQKKLDGKKTDLLDNAKAIKGQKMKEESEEKFSESLRKKKEAAENQSVDQKNLLPPKCKCVHGHCAPNSSHCEKCETGWKGKLCDVPDNNNERKRL